MIIYDLNIRLLSFCYDLMYDQGQIVVIRAKVVRTVD